MRRRLLRIAVGSVAVVLVGTAAIGVMHTKAFRSALMAVGGCPIGGDADATAQQRESARRDALSAARGSRVAPATEFYGLKLGTAVRSEVEALVDDAGACQAERANLVLQCTFASLAKFGAQEPGTAFFRFDAQQRLVAWVVMPRRQPAAGALAVFSGFSRTFTQGLGAPHNQSGEATEAFLSKGALSQAREELHFSNLITKVVATNMGDGVQVVAEAQWLPEQVAAR